MLINKLSEIDNVIVLLWLLMSNLEQKILITEGSSTDEIVLGILRKQGPKTRAELVTLTSIPRSTLYDSLLRLILKEKVIKYSEKPDGPGRPKVFFKSI
jgi:hypothetical protein